MSNPIGALNVRTLQAGDPLLASFPDIPTPVQILSNHRINFHDHEVVACVLSLISLHIEQREKERGWKLFCRHVPAYAKDDFKERRNNYTKFFKDCASTYQKAGISISFGDEIPEEIPPSL